MRVESGELSFMAPVATKFGLRSLSYEQRALDPSPSGRELRIALGYTYFADESVSAFGEMLHVEQPGHAAGADPDDVVRVGLRVAR